MKILRVDHKDGKARPYTLAAIWNETVYLCGQVPVDGNGDVPSSIGEQVSLCVDNLERALIESGSALDCVVRLTVYLADLDEFDEYNKAYVSKFDGMPLPPRTTVEVARFRGEKRIEIEAIAALRGEEV